MSQTPGERQRLREMFDRRDEAGAEADAVQDYFMKRRFEEAADLLFSGASWSGPVLDVGCGRGDWLAQFVEWGLPRPHLMGLDLNHRRLREARKRLPGVSFCVGEGRALPCESSRFSCVVLSLVLSTMQDEASARDLLLEVWRVLRPGGRLLIHDLKHVRPGRGGARLRTRHLPEVLAGQAAGLECRDLILLPPLARRLLPGWPGVVKILERRAVLRGHWMMRIDKEDS